MGALEGRVGFSMGNLKEGPQRAAL